MEIFRALAVITEPPNPQQQAVADALRLPGRLDAAAHADLFTLQLYPYASVYLGAEGMMGGEARDRVAGFWRALGLEPPAEPDHLAVLLAAYAALREQEQAGVDPSLGERLRRARETLLWEHLLSWLPIYLAKAAEVAAAPYLAWGRLLRDALCAEAAVCTELEALPLHLRAAPTCADPREEGAEAFLGSLLAPVRSGMLLVRDDLVRAARELGLGFRYAERRFVLKALLAQDAGAVLGWLAREAERWIELHRTLTPAPARIRAFWLERAAASARLLTLLRSEIDAVKECS